MLIRIFIFVLLWVAAIYFGYNTYYFSNLGGEFKMQGLLVPLSIVYSILASFVLTVITGIGIVIFEPIQNNKLRNTNA